MCFVNPTWIRLSDKHSVEHITVWEVDPAWPRHEGRGINLSHNLYVQQSIVFLKVVKLRTYLVCDVDYDRGRGDALAQEVDLFRGVQLVLFACKKRYSYI